MQFFPQISAMARPNVLLCLAVTFVARVASCAYETQICIKNNTDLAKSASLIRFQRHKQFLSFVTESDIWADKSDLIRRIINEKSQVLVMTAPHKWGKSLNLGLLDFFFNIARSEDGKIAQRDYFVEGKIEKVEAKARKTQFFHPRPIISKYHDVISSYMGKYPVISMNFDFAPTPSLYFFKQAVEEMYGRHLYIRNKCVEIKNDPNAPSDEKLEAAKFENTILRYFKGDNVSGEELARSALLLSEAITWYYNFTDRRIVIIHDEFDNFVTKLNFNEGGKMYSQVDKTYYRNVYQKFMNATYIENKFLFKAVLTGIVPVSKQTCISGSSDVREYNCMDESNMRLFYGITETDFSTMMTLRGINASYRQTAIDFYGGYCAMAEPNIPIIPTLSALRFVNEKKISSFWWSVGMSYLILSLLRFPNFKSTLHQLINNEYVFIPYERIHFIGVDECELLENLINSKCDLVERSLNDTEMQISLSFQCHLGYLTVIPDKSNIRGKACLRIPNEEVRGYLRDNMNTTHNFQAQKNVCKYNCTCG